MLKRKIARMLCLVLVVFLCSPCAFTAAISAENLEKFAANNIMFYDPEEDGKKPCNGAGGSGGECDIYGDTDELHLWSAFRSLGLNVNQVAGLFGNFLHEGGMNPFRQEGAYNIVRNINCMTQEGDPYDIHTGHEHHHSQCMQEHGYSGYKAGNEVAGIGIGFAQITYYTQREELFARLQEGGYTEIYFEGDAYKKYGSTSNGDEIRALIAQETGSEADYWSVFCIEIHYLYDIFANTNTVEGSSKTHIMEDTKDKTTPNEEVAATVAGQVAAEYERCGGGCYEGGDSWNKRREEARKVIQRYNEGAFDAYEKGTGPQVNKGSQSSSHNNAGELGSGTTMIGDQITVATKDAIVAKMPNIDIYADAGKHFFQDGDASNGGESGATILRRLKDEKKLHGQVVIALGSNDTLKEDEIIALLEELGPSYNFYFVTNYNDSDANIYNNGNNRTFAAANAVYTNSKVIEWANAVASARQKNEEVEYTFEDDKITPKSDAAKKLFADTIYANVSGEKQAKNRCNERKYINAPEDPMVYMKQYVADTNYVYGLSIRIPETYSIGNRLDMERIPSSINFNSEHAQTVATGISKDVSEIASGSCWKGDGCDQCTALAGWFVTVLSEYKYGGGWGGSVVTNMVNANPSLADKVTVNTKNSTTTPPTMSVFSQYMNGYKGDDSNAYYNHSYHTHTGAIVRIDDGRPLAIENNWSGKLAIAYADRDISSGYVWEYVDLTDGIKLDWLGHEY
jgi:hypothetical protein